MLVLNTTNGRVYGSACEVVLISEQKNGNGTVHFSYFPDGIDTTHTFEEAMELFHAGLIYEHSFAQQLHEIEEEDDEVPS